MVQICKKRLTEVDIDEALEICIDSKLELSPTAQALVVSYGKENKPLTFVRKGNSPVVFCLKGDALKKFVRDEGIKRGDGSSISIDKKDNPSRRGEKIYTIKVHKK